MQLCSKCGDYNSDESIFCGHCANRLNNNCPACGFQNLWEQKFCGSCGKQLLSDQVLTESAMQYGRTPVSVDTAKSEMNGGAVKAQPMASHAGATVSAPANPVMPGSAPAAEKAQPMEESHFDAYPDLESYALASIEFAHWEQIVSNVANPEGLEAYRRQCQSFLEERIVAAGGQINASKKNILFISFKREPSLDGSLDKAIDLCLTLLSAEFSFQHEVLKLRIGLDIEYAKARNPLTSTLERSVATPGTLTVSEAVYQRVGQRYKMEPIGPITLGNRSMQFYKLLRPGTALPEMEEVITPAKLDESIAYLNQPPPPPPIPQSRVEEPIVREPAPMPQVPVLSASSSVSEEFEPKIVAKPVPSPAPSPAASESQAKESPPQEPPKGGPPALPQYISPILGLRKAPRAANLNYESGIDALNSELSGFLAQGVSNNKGKVLALCATDGLGKSSIIHMVRGKIDPENQRAIWVGGHNYRCFQHSQLPLYYWIEMIQNLLSLVFEGQPSRDVKEHIRKFLGFIYDDSTDLTTEELRFLEDFLAVHPPEPLSVESRGNLGRIEDFFFDFLSTLASKRPLIIVMEDLMFADAASLELLVALLQRNLLEQPIYIIFTQARDFYATGSLGEILQKVPYKELIIGELGESEAEQFLDDGPLGGRLNEFPPRMIDAIIKPSKGLPLFLEEAMRLLHLREVMMVDPKSHKFVMNEANASPAGMAIPDNLPALIRARFEFLGEKTLYILQLASILGEKFAVNVLMAMAQVGEEEFNESLTTLFHHGYLLPDAVNTGRFRHGLIWETVYNSIEPELRMQMHQLISEALENDFHQGLTVNPMLVAYHSERGELPNRALNYWNLAGIYAGQVGSLTGMNMSMFRALEIQEEVVSEPLYTQELALRIMESLGVFNLEADPDLASQMLEWTFYFRKSEGDAAKLIEPLGFLASAYEQKGNFPKALVTLEKALELVDANAYPLEAVSLQINKLEYLYTLGRLQQARELIEQVIEPGAERQGYAQGGSDFFDAYLQAQLLKAQVLLAQCENAAIPVVEEALRHARERNLEGLAIALQLVMGQIFLRNGQYESCDREADSLLNAIESMEDSEWFLAQWGLLAIMYHCELEDWESASQLVLTVVSKSEASRDYLTWITAQAYAGHIAGKVGKIKEARQLIEQAIGLSSDYRFASAALIGWRFLADFELALGSHEVAYEIAVKALDIANKPDIRNTYEVIQLTMVAARSLLTQNKPKEAGKLLEPIWPQVARTKWNPLIAVCAFEIGQLYKQLAQNVPSDLSRKYLTRSVEFFLKTKGIGLELRQMPMVKKVDAAMPQL